MKENIRFELAYGKKKNHYQTIENGKKRALVLFEEIFKDSKTVQLIFVISHYSSKNKINKFLYKNKFKLIDRFTTNSWNNYYDGETSILIIETEKADLRTAKIIDGICYKDFYTHSKLKIKNPLLSNIYDDRGCNIWSDDLKKQKEIYTKYHSWLLDYDKESISNFYESVI